MKTYYIAQEWKDSGDGYTIAETFDIAEAKKKLITNIDRMSSADIKHVAYWDISGYNVSDDFNPDEQDLFDYFETRCLPDADEYRKFANVSEVRNA